LPVTLPETIVQRRCAARIPYARNARTHSDQQVAQIAASILEFGFTNPVLIDEEDGIIAGVVGRDEEIDLLLRRWARTKTGDGQVVLVSGEAGLGKSRITAALAERLHAQPHTRLRYFCSPYHQDSALYPFIDQLGRASQFARDDSPAVKLDKLEALLARAMPPDEDVALLADLLSLPVSERHPLPNLTPQRKKEKSLEALIRQLEGLARQQPLARGRAHALREGAAHAARLLR
jgi:hypothetical protein